MGLSQDLYGIASHFQFCIKVFVVIFTWVTEQILRLLGNKKELCNNYRLELQGIELQVLNRKQREGGSTFEVRTVRYGLGETEVGREFRKGEQAVNCHVK